MVKQIIELLQSDDYYNVSETVEIAKGKYKIPETVQQGLTQIQRKWQSRKS